MGGDNVYQVTVEAADGTYMDTQDVTVTVTEVEDEVVTPEDPLLAVYDPNGDGRIEKADMRLAVGNFFLDADAEQGGHEEIGWDLLRAVSRSKDLLARITAGRAIGPSLP